MDKTRKWRKILAMMLTVVMMLQNVQSVIVSAGVTTEEIEARLNGQTQQTQEQQPSESQVETRANGETYQTQQQTQQQEEQQESQQQDQQTTGSSSGDASETGISDGSQNAGNNADAQNDTTKISNANVSATITQSIFQEEISGGTYNFAQMTAKITNNDTENAATGVQVTALLPSQLSYINEYGKETTGIIAYVAPYQAQANGYDLSAIPSETLDTYANTQIALWVNQTIGAGETAEYNFAVQIQDGITDVSGMDTVWYVNGTKCNYSWENAELLTPAQTPEATEEPEVTETPEETPAPEVTETPEETPAPEVTEALEETPAPEVTEAPEETPAPEVTETPEETPAPEVTEAPEETPIPEVTEAPEETLTPEVTEAPEKTPTPTISEDKKTKLEEQDKLLSQSKDRLNIKKSSKKAAKMGEKNSEVATYEGEGDSSDSEGSNSDITDKSNIMCNGNKVDVSLKINGKPVDTSEDITLGRNDNISLSIAYQYSEDNKPKARENNEGQLDNVRYYDLPAQGWTYSNTNGYIKNGNDNVGTYEIINDNGKMRVKLTYYESFLKAYPKNIKGTFTLRMQVDKAYVAGSDEINFDFPGLTKRVTLNPSGLTGSKEYNYDKDDPDKKPILNADGTLTYYIKLQPDTANVKNIEITDRLTGQFDYVDNSFELIKFEGNNEISRSDINGNTTINHQDKTAKVNISELKYGENTYYKLKYDVKPEDGIRDFKASNSASWTWGENGKGTGSGSGSAPNIDLTNETLKKSGVVDNENIITYTVEINKIGALLLPEGVTNGKLVLTDKIPNNVTWLGDVTITGGTTQGWSYDDKTRMLTVTVDDGTPVTLVYKVRVNGAEGDTVSSVENTINLKGTSISSKEENKNIYIQDASATARGDNGTFTIVKRGLYSVEVNTDEGKKIEQPKLEGAEFELHQIVLENGSLKDKLVDTKTSDGRGRITFGDAENVDNQIQKDTLYYYMETKAPTATAPDGSERYIKDSTKNYFIYRENGLSADLESAVSRAGITYKVFEDGTILDPVTNDTEPTPKSISFEATKNLDGKTATVPFKFNLMLSSYRPSSSGYVTSTYAPGDRNAAPVSISDAADALNIENDNVTGGYNQTVEAKGKIVFPKVNFKYEGTYTFVMRELAENGDYVYDKNTKNITVIVERDSDGKLMVTPSSDVKNITFNNSTAVRLKIKKVINIADTENRTFGFTIECSDKTFTFDGVRLNGNQVSINKGVAEVEITVPAGETEATIELTGIPKDKVLTVKEKTNNMPSGWSYTSTDPENGQVTMDKTKTVTITNEYKETGEATFKVKKNFNGWADNPNQEFTFDVTSLGNDIGNLKNPMPKQGSITLKSDAFKKTEVTKSFGKLSFEQLGNYYYKITETIEGVDANYRKDGITYDPKVTYVKVSVVKGSSGKSTVKLYSSDPMEALQTETITSINKVVKQIEGSEVTAQFTNSVSEASITFKATKKLTGRKLNADEFTFVLVNKDNKNQILSTAKNDVDGNVEFDPITYKSTEIGSHTYTIYEQNRGEKKNGVQYDDAEYTVTVHVSQNADGTLKITCNDDTEDLSGKVYTIPKADGKDANFVNEYSASTSIQFTGIKELQNKELLDGQFKFSIEGYNINNGKATVSNIGREIKFPRIIYTEEDLKENKIYLESKQYDYTVTEVEPTDAVDHKKAGIKYDTKSYMVHVVLSRNSNGELITTVTVGDNATSLVSTGINPSIYALTGNQPTFVNVYEANDIRVKLVGNKKLENQKLIDGKYNFKIEPYNSGTPTSTIDGAQVVSNKASENANITFPELKITLNDMKGTNGYPESQKIFQYCILEVKESESGVTYSKEQYLVEIKVTNTNGRLTATGTVEKTRDKDGNTVTNNVTERFIANDMEIPEVDIAKGTDAFTNTYNAETTVQFKGTKSLVDTLGKAKSVSGRNFEFKISGPKLGENGADGTRSVPVADDGTFEFPEINYDVTDLNFENGNYTSKKFSYTITEVMPKDETGADKDVKDGVTYNKTSYNVVVTVTNDIKTGTLTQKVALAGNSPKDQRITGNKGVYTLSAGENKATFTNVYDATTEYPFKVVKRLAGREFKEGDNFRFELLKGRTHVQTIEMKVGQAGTEIKTDDAGQYLEASFDPQKYGLSDVDETYEYTIRELNPETAMEGVTIDDDIYIVDITVTDNNDGTLTATSKRILGDDENDEVDFDKAVFINTYKAEGTAQIVAKKFLSPGDIGTEKFTFTLTQIDENGAVVEGGVSQTKQNDGNGIIFDPITYHQKGEKDASGNVVQTTDAGKTFWYEVKEATGTDTKYTYDNKVYKVKVEVSINPDDNRKLVTTQTIYDATGKEVSEIGEKVEAIVFTNRYDATGAITLTGKKVVEGEQKLTAGEFNFEVKEGVGENAKVVATGTNDEDGNIQFSEIRYAYNSETNDLGEHIYTVTEIQPKDGDGYVYDLTSRKVVVKVTDNKNNTLNAEIISASEKDTDLKSDVTDNVINSFNNKKISITIRKTNAQGNKLAGAELTLYKYDDENKGDVVDTWETEEGADHTITGKLIAGKTYILEETKVPDGYAKANPIIFTVKNDDTRTIEMTSGQLDEDGNVVMVDQKTGVQVLKVDANGKGVKDAQLAVYDGDKKIDEWTSDGDPHAIEGLVAGHKYTLKELKAPDGYKKAADQEFEVSDSKIVEVRMTDKPTNVSIMKVDGNGQGLKGAVLEIRDSEGELIDRWESDGKAHVVEGKLIEGATYTLNEISAPDGYTLAKPQTFQVSETDDVTKVTMENIANSVTISKKALTGTDSIAGAVLRVLDATGKEVVPKWTTEAGKDKVVTGVLKPNVTYTLEEVSAPSGYAKADNITFAVDEDGVLYVNHEKATSVVMRDAQLRLCVSKTDITGKAELPGAVLQIIEKDTKTVVDEWTTTTTPHYTDKGLVSGKTYLLHEKTAPAGYAYAEDVEFTLRNDSVVGSEQKVTMYDAPNTVVITKTDLTGKELAGAKLQILDANGKVLESWTSSTEEHRVEASLEAGKEYILHEVEAPEGYVLAEDVKFTVNKDGSTTRVAMKDAPTGVNISKTDLTGSKEIAGAVLQVLDKNGATVEQWTSDGTTHTVESKLVAGETYILHEVSAPAGYRTAKDIEFTVDKTGKTTKVVMKDAPTQASILKTDQNGKGLAGATLAVKDSTGKVLEQWTSDGSAHVIEGLLTVGQTYTLSEISAPAGYTVAPDQTFTMEDKDVIEVTMVDTQETTGSGQITVTKKVSLVKGGDIIDMIANDDTFYVNIFTDAAGKYPYKGAKPQAIHLVNASAGSVTFDGLGTGTYYVYETDADGNVISLDTDSTHNGVQFMCTVDGGTNSVTLDLKAGAKEGVVNLDNMFYDIPDGYSYKANISINKQVLKGTDQTTVDDTFYAGIFTKDDDGVYNLFRVVELVQNDTVTVEVPLGGDDGTQPINYYVLETDADGNILDLDVFEYEVSGEGTVALSVDNTTGNINLVNKVPEEKNGKLRVQKVDENGVGLAGASFRLTNADGEVVEEWTSEASAHELELEPGTYTLTEVQAPDGYTGEGSLTITVDEDYNFTVDGQIEYSYKDDLIKVVNKSVAPTPTPEVTPGVTPGPNGGTTTTTSSGGGSTPVSYSTLSGKVAVKTGDNTPIGAYVLILVVAAAAIAGGVVYKKKRRKDK